MKKTNAFTLVELIIVLLMIILIMAIIKPAIRPPGGDPGHIFCLGNLRALAKGWLMYSQDNRDYLISGDIGQAEYDWINEPIPDYSQEQNLKLNKEQNRIQKGALWKYVMNMNAYHCFSDRRMYEERGPWLSYSIVGGLNGQDRYEQEERNYSVAVKYSQIKKPEEKIVFVEEDAISGSNPRSWQIYDPDDLNKWT